ncbi:hypothetical protein [uncultured Brevibacillus sp.]|uniref:hypothetical protein n=1 Tax=uncultured Brevibacillus sp. TaxID=169970 RepID=UPI002597C884|nr:hypothetical protein [uncultured Brevibacillus sp.]
MEAGRDLDKRDAQADLELCEAATPGPWKWEDGNDMEVGRFVGGDGKIICDFGDGEHYYPTEGTKPDWNDERFILEAREALPYWIHRAQAVEAALRWYADQDNYSIPHLGCAPKVMADRGKRAHDILKELGIEVGK